MALGVAASDATVASIANQLIAERGARGDADIDEQTNLPRSRCAFANNHPFDARSGAEVFDDAGSRSRAMR